MYDAFVLEENGLPYKLGTWFNRGAAQAALDDLKSIAVPCAEQVWYYVREHEDLA